MKRILLACVCVASAASAAAHADDLAGNRPLSDFDLAEVRAGDAVENLITFPGPDVKLDFFRVEPLDSALARGFIVNLRFQGFSESCGAGNCSQAAFTLSARITLSGLALR